MTVQKQQISTGLHMIRSMSSQRLHLRRQMGSDTSQQAAESPVQDVRSILGDETPALANDSMLAEEKANPLQWSSNYSNRP